MVKTIGNPLSWTAQAVGGAAGHVTHSVERIGSHEQVDLRINTLDMWDIRAALQDGLKDFTAARADVIFLVAVYPVIGLVLAGFGLHANLIPLLFPLVAGFALLGPLAAVSLYEISRRRERGEPVSWSAALGVIGRPRFSAIVVLGLYMVGLFLVWMLTAGWVYEMTMGPEPPASLATFATQVFTTSEGWAMILLGTAIGFAFALVALATSVVSFPLLLDRPVGVPVAVTTSFRVFRKNPGVILAWGGIVAGGLVLGAIPAFVGMVVVLPILGHATWHLYRRAVS